VAVNSAKSVFSAAVAAAFNVTTNAVPSPKLVFIVATPVAASTNCCLSTSN
jgi:hypothetical protein